MSVIRLSEFRRTMNLTQKEMAERIGVSLSYYTKIESGHKEPSFQFLKKLKNSFGELVDINLFF